MIDLFIFDEGGVMIRNFLVLPDMAAAMGMSQEELRPLLVPNMNDFSCGRIDSAEYWRLFTARTGIEVAENYWDTLFNPTPIAESFELVRELAALPASYAIASAGGVGVASGRNTRAARVVGGTNTIDCHHEKNRRLGFYEGFQAVYASNEIGFSKPDPVFWLAILEAEGVEPENAFFTDDNADNVDVARDLGIEARLFVDADTLRRDLVALGVPLASKR